MITLQYPEIGDTIVNSLSKNVALVITLQQCQGCYTCRTRQKGDHYTYVILEMSTIRVIKDYLISEYVSISAFK